MVDTGLALVLACLAVIAATAPPTDVPAIAAASSRSSGESCARGETRCVVEFLRVRGVRGALRILRGGATEYSDVREAQSSPSERRFDSSAESCPDMDGSDCCNDASARIPSLTENQSQNMSTPCPDMDSNDCTNDEELARRLQEPSPPYPLSCKP